MADIKAQVAANERGVQELTRVVDRYGWDTVAAYMGHVMDNAEESVRRVLDRLPSGSFAYTMDDGSPLRVAITVDAASRSATVDFTGTGAQRGDNFNAPPAVTRAAVLYSFRCLVGTDIPLNDGCLVPLHIVIPPGTFLSPEPGAAVVAGNTEVSQAVCNALLGAMGAVACSQATMNNFIFGDDTIQYYETICGGGGAGPGFDRRLRDPDAHDQHPHDRPGSAGTALPGAAGGVRHPPRLRRCGRVGGGRRLPPAHPLPAADAGGDRRLPPQRGPVRHGRRRAGPAGRAMGGAGGRHARPADRHRQHADGGGRRVRHRHAGGRRLGFPTPGMSGAGRHRRAAFGRRRKISFIAPRPSGLQRLRLFAALLVLSLAVTVTAAWIVPRVLDWGQYRAAVEAVASAGLGRPVRIAGPIRLSLLPEATLVAGDVTVPDTGDGASATAAQLRLRVALGALLAGRIEPQDLALRGVQMRLPWPLTALVSGLGWWPRPGCTPAWRMARWRWAACR